MKKLLIAIVAVLAIGLMADWSLAKEDAQQITGILIDDKCSKKDGKTKTEEQAAGHPAACALKCAGGGEALLVISGDKTYKLDEASAAKAKEYLTTNEKEKGATRVAIEGTVKDNILTITSIKKAEAKKAA
jgi:hypothetical protein